MGRGKLRLEFITDGKSRRTVFKRRKTGLMKKAEEFSICCGVDTCMVIYNPDDCSGRGPVTWPQDGDKVKRVIERYLSESVDRRTKRAVALPDFFMGRKRKLETEIAKARSANLAAKYPVSDELIKGLSQDQLGDMLSVLQVKLKTAQERLIKMKENASRDEPKVDLSQTEDLEFNTSVHSLGHDQMMFDPTNMDAPYLPPLTDPSYSTVTWSPSQVADSSASCCSIGNHQDHNNYYCYSSLAVPTYDSNFQSSAYLTHQSRMAPTDQYYSQMQGGGRVQEITIFDSSGQHGMPGNASRDAPTMGQMQTGDLEFNSSVHSVGHDHMLFGPMNMDAPYLPPPMDTSYSSTTWSQSQVADSSSSCCSSIGNHQDRNNYYYNSSLAFPIYDSDFSRSSSYLTHQSMASPIDQYYSQMQDAPQFPQSTAFNSSGQHGMPIQQQSLMFPYPMMQQGDDYMPPDEEVQLDNGHSSSSRFFFPGNGGDR